MKIAFYTLGCRLNQAETESIIQSFKTKEFNITDIDDKAGVFIINTCTVTTKSEQKARRIIRKLSRENPQSFIIVTGCYAELENNTLQNIAKNVIVVPLSKKDILLDLPGFMKDIRNMGKTVKEILLDSLLYEEHEVDDPGEGRFRYTSTEQEFHSRGYIKIQDGCDNNCAYCRVSIARGKALSLNQEDVIQRMLDLQKSGYKEIVLTGVNISAYKSGETGLGGLISLILEKTKGFRLRLSSIEPDTIDNNFTNAVSQERVCGYFHIPIQSMSDSVLVGMDRKYLSDRIFEVVNTLRETKDDPFIAADIIVGFPGESDEDFHTTFEAIKKMGLNKLHVFPYSPRPGTKAFDMKNRVPERVSRERAKILRDWSENAEKEYWNRWIGKDLKVVLEEEASEHCWYGTSGNYINIFVENVPEDAGKGDLVSARFTGVRDGKPVGIVI